MALPQSIADWLIGGIGVVLGWVGSLLTGWLRKKPTQ